MAEEKLRIGLELNPRSLKLVEIRSFSAGDWVLSSTQEVPVGESLVSADGEILDPEAFKELLRVMFRKKELRGAKIALSLPDPQVVLRLFSTPAANEGNLEAVIQEEVQAYALFQETEPLIVFKKVDESVERDAEGPVLRTIFCASSRNTVELVTRIFEEMNLELEGIYSRFAGVLSCVSPGDRPGTTVIMDIGDQKTNLLFISRGKPKLMRIIDFGTDDLTSPQVAGSLDLSENSPAPPEVVSKRESLLVELKSSLAYFRSRFLEHGNIEAICLFLNPDKIKGLEGFLQRKLLLKIVGESELRPVDKVPPGYSAAVGLALEGAEAKEGLNLIPTGYRQKKKLAGLAYTVLVPALIMLLVSWLFNFGVGQVSRYKNKTVALLRDQDTAKISETTTVMKEVEQLQTELEKEKKKKEATSSISLASSVSWFRIVGDIHRSVPEGVWLKTVSLEGGEGAFQGKISGYAVSQLRLMKFMENLSSFPMFKNASLPSALADKFKDREVVAFVISFQVQVPMPEVKVGTR